MITIPRETADAALIAISTCRSVLVGKHSSAQLHVDAIGSLNAHMEIIRAALNEAHDCEACMGATCACADAFPGLDDLYDVSIHDPQTPRHIFQGHCPTECSPDTLDPDCPACRTLLPKKEVAA